MHIGPVRGEGGSLSVSESKMTSDLCLDHVVSVFPHTTNKAPNIDHVVSLQLVEAVVDGQHSTTPPHACTAVYRYGTGLRWVGGVDGS